MKEHARVGGRERATKRIVCCCVLLLGAAGTATAANEETLVDAAEQGNGALVGALLDKGADVDARQIDGMTALHWAAYRDDTDMAALLVRAGANVDAENAYGVPPISLAATNANADIVTLLLDAGANPNATLHGGETVLMTAARAGSAEAVRALLAKGADPNAREERDQTALMWAAAEGHADVVDALLGAHADLHAQLKSGFTPLFFAAREGHIEVVRRLLQAGGDVNEPLQRAKDAPDPAVNNASYRPVDDGISLLLMAVRNGHFDLAIELVKAGADPNDQRSGFGPLHTISWVRKPDKSDRGDPAPIGSGNLTSLEFVRELVKLGADVNLRLADGAPRQPNSGSRLRSAGATPFLLAADRADVALMRLLLELGADPFITNLDNSTALMAAAGLGTTAPEEEAGTEAEALIVTRLMLDLGADVNAINNEGETAMHAAASGGFPTVVQLLAERGADIAIWNQKNYWGSTPLFIAEGYREGGGRRSPATIDALVKLMASAGVSTDGERPGIVDIYARPATPPAPPANRALR
jgi:ankyrin repeat protein